MENNFKTLFEITCHDVFDMFHFGARIFFCIQQASASDDVIPTTVILRKVIKRSKLRFKKIKLALIAHNYKTKVILLFTIL